MTSSDRTLLGQLRRIASPALIIIGVLTCLSAAGCAEMMAPFLRTGGEVDGSWTGTVRTITLRATHDPALTWDAAAIQLEDGPALPDPPHGTTLPERAVLVMTRRLPLRIADPRDLNLREGVRVRVRGTLMHGGDVYGPPSAKQIENDVKQTTSLTWTDGRPYAAIMLDGKPKVLRE